MATPMRFSGFYGDRKFSGPPQHAHALLAMGTVVEFAGTNSSDGDANECTCERQERCGQYDDPGGKRCHAGNARERLRRETILFGGLPKVDECGCESTVERK